MTNQPEQYWISRGQDLIGAEILEEKDYARQASTYNAIAAEILDRKIQNVLDIGCNVAALEMFLRMRGYIWGYYGVDSNPNAVEHCKARGLLVQEGNLKEHKSVIGQIECVVVKDVFEHLDSLNSAERAFQLSEKTVILSFFIPPNTEPEVIHQTEHGYYHNKYHEPDLILIAYNLGFKLRKRIDTFETGTETVNRTYVFTRAKFD